MKKPQKKLSISTETLRALSSEELSRAAGGVTGVCGPWKPPVVTVDSCAAGSCYACTWWCEGNG